VKYVHVTFPDLAKVKLTKIQDAELDKRLQEGERKSIVTKYKFGILYVKENQTNENEMFSNVEGSPEYEEFLGFLGEKIMLQSWKNYRGGLDVKANTTGTHSVYTRHRGYEIMFHVSTLLPFQPEDLQRVERKRHLGNDIVVIVFKEGDQPFDPLCLTTHFNHVFCVISVDKRAGPKTHYKVAIANKIGVPPYGPFFKAPPVYEKNDEFRDFLLTKLINSERVSLSYAPEFKTKMIRTNKQILSDMAKEYILKSKSKSKPSSVDRSSEPETVTEND